MFLYLSLICALLAPALTTAEIVDRIVARVNDDIVTLHDVRQAAVPYLLQRGGDPATAEDPARRTQLFRDVLNDLVDSKLLVIEAAKLELQIRDDELNQWLAYTRQQQGLSEEQFLAMIKQYGMTPDGYREMVRQNLLRIRMVKIKVGSQVNIAQSEVDQLYRERFGVDGGAERFVTVSHVLVQPADSSNEAHADARKRGLELLKRLSDGEEFDKVALDSSDIPTSQKGGFLGSFRRGELDPEFEKIAFALEPGKVSELVLTRFGYHIILVTGVEDRDAPDVEERKDVIRGELHERAMERQLAQYIQTLRTRSFVDIRL